MSNLLLQSWVLTLRAMVLASLATLSFAQTLGPLRWETVANKNDIMPNSITILNPAGRTYNSFNQPSVNSKAVVVFRARSRGGQPLGPPTRGIYTRDMTLGRASGDELWTVAGGSTELLRGATEVPYPNNTSYPPTGTLASFIEFPSIPRIGILSNVIATRGNHQPVWTYTPPGATESAKAGTSGVYVKFNGGDPLRPVLTGASRLGAVPEFWRFAVPGVSPPLAFDVFPGSPAVIDSGTIAFKGNYTADRAKTGVFYRHLLEVAAGGPSPIELIANSDTEIPNLSSCASYHAPTFDSTSPPSAAVDFAGVSQMVFLGLDNEESPLCGGIYQSALTQPPKLVTLVAIGVPVPGVSESKFTRLGEGLSYDGRYVGFWGAWGNENRTIRLYCPTEGNQSRIDFCNNTGPFDSVTGDQNSICDDDTDDTDRCYQEKQIPVNQGIFTYDTRTQQTQMIARTGSMYYDFMYWVYSGRVPGTGEGGEDEGDEDGEPARWRSGTFVSASSRGDALWTAFKGKTGSLTNPIDGIYLRKTPGYLPIVTLVDTTMSGTTIDPEAPVGSRIVALGLEREGFRGRWLVITAQMVEEGGTEEAGMAGIYLTNVP